MKLSTRRSPAALFTADAIVGLAIVAFMATLFVVAISRQNRAASRLADSRQAIRLAEQALTEMQSGRDASAAAIQVTRLQAASDVPGFEWVSVRATANGRSAELVGLVKASKTGGAK